jgi:hypothetical protein
MAPCTDDVHAWITTLKLPSTACIHLPFMLFICQNLRGGALSLIYVSYAC